MITLPIMISAQMALPNLPNDLGIGFINGIWNDFKGSKEGAEYVSKVSRRI